MGNKTNEEIIAEIEAKDFFELSDSDIYRYWKAKGLSDDEAYERSLEHYYQMKGF